MIKFTIDTPVQSDFRQVVAGFTSELLQKLSPPFPPVKLLRYDGNRPGDEVHLELNFIFFKQTWVSQITEQQLSDDGFYFVDEGTKLPFFLKSWHHKHHIFQTGSSAVVRDQVQFSTPFRWLDYLMWPLIYAQFLYRKPIYKRIFKRTEAA